MLKYFAISPEVIDHDHPIVIVGGRDISMNEVDVVEVLDNNTYCNADTFPTKIFGAEGINGMICGGNSYDHNGLVVHSGCWRINPNGTWTSVKNMLEARTEFSLSKAEDDVIAIGGESQYNSFLSSVEKYSSKSKTWYRMRDAPTEISFHCTVMVNKSNLLVIGGYQNSMVIANQH